MENALNAPSPAQLARYWNLAPREADTAWWLMRGCTNAEIARAMEIGIGTVKTYMMAVCAKLGVRSRTQAALRLHGIKLGE